MATAKVTAIEIRQGDDIMLYLYNSRGACARIVTLKNVGEKILVVEESKSSRMPLEIEHNKDSYVQI